MHHSRLHASGGCGVDTEALPWFQSSRCARRKLAATANMSSNASVDILHSHNTTRPRGNGIAHTIPRPPGRILRGTMRAEMQGNRLLQDSATQIDRLWANCHRRGRKLMTAASVSADDAMDELNHTIRYRSGRATSDIDAWIQSRRRAVVDILAQNTHEQRRQRGPGAVLSNPGRTNLRPQNGGLPRSPADNIGLPRQYRERNRQDRSRRIGQERELLSKEGYWDGDVLAYNGPSEGVRANPESSGSSQTQSFSQMNSAPSVAAVAVAARSPPVAHNRRRRPDNDSFAQPDALIPSAGTRPRQTHPQPIQVAAGPSLGNAAISPSRQYSVAAVPLHGARIEDLPDDVEFGSSEPPPEYSLEDLHLERLNLGAT